MSESSRDIRPAEAKPRRSRRPLRRDGWRNSDILRATALVIGVYLALRLFWRANPLFFTAFLGILFGLAVSSGADRLARFGIRRGAAAGLIVLAFFGLLFGFGAWMAPTLRAQSEELRHRLPDALQRAQEWGRTHRNGMIGMMVDGALNADSSSSADTAAEKADSATLAAKAKLDTAVTLRHGGDSLAGPTAAPTKPDSATIASTLKQHLGSRFGGAKRLFFPVLTSTVEIFAGILIIVFLSIYIGADPQLYHGGIMSLFPRRRRQRAGEVLSAIAAVLRRWLITQLIAMAVIGVVTTVLLLLLRVKAALALGMLSGLFEFIPTVGPIVSAVPAVAMAFLDSPQKALIVVGAYVAIHFLETHILIPLLMKGGVDVPPVLTILAQALMVMLFGFLGLMTAVPILAATLVGVKMLYVEDVVGQRTLGPDENPHRGVVT